MTFGSAQPTRVLGLTDAEEIAVGGRFSCARKSAGTVVCWGNNEFGQLGIPRGNAQLVPGTALREATDAGYIELSGITQITAGPLHACALQGSTGMYCWGNNSLGALGSGDVAVRPRAAQVRVGPGELLTNVVSAALSDNNTCALLGGGAVRCWGDERFAGHGPNADGGLSGLPYANEDAVVDIPPAQGLGGAELGNCAAAIDGAGGGGSQAWCWGYAVDGAYGVTAPPDGVFYSPVVHPNLTSVVAVAGGWRHVCVLSNAATVLCAGLGHAGQLGNGGLMSSTGMVEVNGLYDVEELSVSFNSACALSSNGEVKCWGHNHWGQLGRGAVGGDFSLAEPVQF